MEIKRQWGSYKVIAEGDTWKVKELSIDSSKALSKQRHFVRSEHWHVVEGNLQIDLEYSSGYKTSKIYSAGESIDIPPLTWHKATNVGLKQVKVIEVWLGKFLSEEDIERQ